MSAQQRLTSPDMRYITARGIALGPRLGEFGRLGDFELLRPAMGGPYAYEQSLSQASEYVAVVMLVSAVEALSIPNTSWDASERSRAS